MMFHRSIVRGWLGTAALAAAVAAAVAIPPAASRAQEEDFEAFVARPSAEHQRLKHDVGTWDATIKAYMAGPDAEPMVSKGVETNRMMGDLWLISDFSGDFGGAAFSGHGVTGFDAQKGKYVGIWTDTMTATPMVLEGTYDEATGELTMVGESYDPALRKSAQTKLVSKTIDATHRGFAMYMKAPEYGDDWVKGMEIEYVKRPE